MYTTIYTIYSIVYTIYIYKRRKKKVKKKEEIIDSFFLYSHYDYVV